MQIAAFSVTPIGVVHSPFKDKRSAPRQPSVAAEAAGTVELYPDARYEYGLQHLEQWSHIWVLFWFHLNTHWRPKVRPPRSAAKKGVFATRAPHRPNPIGMSAVRLERIEGRVLYVRGLDIIDGSPVVDLKPYVPYADIVSEAAAGWLEGRPDVADDIGPRYSVFWTEDAKTRLEWLKERHRIVLREDVERALALGAAPHPYRRIKRDGAFMRLALRDWRFRFVVDGQAVTVVNVSTGYRSRELNDPSSVPRADTSLDVHRAFVAKFG